MADGVLTVSGFETEGESSSYEDTVSVLVQEILDHVQDPSFTTGKVLRVLNRGLREMVSTLSAQNVWLPSLAATGEVTAKSDALSCRLPADWVGNLHACLDLTNGQTLRVVDWAEMSVMMEGGLPGRLHSVAIYGGTLRYWHAPDVNHRLRLSYHKMPEKLTSTTRLTSLPPELSSSLLVDYGLFKLYETLETEEGGPKANTKYFGEIYMDKLTEAVRTVGAFPLRPVEPFDSIGWGWM